MRDMHEIGRAPGFGAVEIAQLQPEIVDDRERPRPARVPAGDVAGAEIGVDIVFAEPGILDRAFGDLGMQQRERFAVGLARRMLVDAGDIRHGGATPQDQPRDRS